MILTYDSSDFTFLDCAYEELLQSLDRSTTPARCPGPCSTTTCRWASSTSTDQYILNLLYDPRIKAGMTVQEVKAMLPEVLTEVRAWVAKINNLPE